MKVPNKKRYYSPQFSQLAAVSVRRLAWALDKPHQIIARRSRVEEKSNTV